MSLVVGTGVLPLQDTTSTPSNQELSINSSVEIETLGVMDLNTDILSKSKIEIFNFY